jgi:hypothetical protein
MLHATSTQNDMPDTTLENFGDFVFVTITPSLGSIPMLSMRRIHILTKLDHKCGSTDVS